jgi:hypothetical protein
MSPSSPPSSWDLGGERRGVREGSGGAGVGGGGGGRGRAARGNYNVGAVPSCLFAAHPLDLAFGELAGWY